MRGVVTIGVAASVSGATYLSSQAGDHWQQALRDQIKWSAAVQDDVRRVYSDEAPIAWQLEFAETVARQAGREVTASGIRGDLAQVKANGHALAVAQLRSAHAGMDHVLGSDRYKMAGGGQDLPRRLADVRRAHAAPLDDAWQAGDRISPSASLLALVPGTFAVLQLGFAVLGRLRSRRRRTAVRGGESAPTGSFKGTISPAGGQTPVRHQWSRGLAVLRRRAVEAVPLLAWLLLTLLPIAQVHYSKQEQRDHQVAAGQAMTISTVLACSGMRASFAEQANQMLLVQEVISVGDRIAALDVDDPQVTEAFHALDEHEDPMWAELAGVSRRMGRVPTIADGLDSATADVLSAENGKIERLSAQQRLTADSAGEAGRKARLLNLAIFLAAIAGARRHNAYGAFGRLASLVVLCGAVLAGAWTTIF